MVIEGGPYLIGSFGNLSDSFLGVGCGFFTWYPNSYPQPVTENVNLGAEKQLQCKSYAVTACDNLLFIILIYGLKVSQKNGL